MRYSMYRTVSTIEAAKALADLQVSTNVCPLHCKSSGLFFGMTREDVLKYDGMYIVEFILDEDHGVLPTKQTTAEGYAVGMAMEYCFHRHQFRKLEDCILKVNITLRDGRTVDVVEWR